MNESSSKRISFDTNRERLGKIYAKGLLGAAESQRQTKHVLEELDSLLDDVFEELPDLEQILASPRISVDEKNGMLEKAFGGRMTPLFLNFLKVTARHDRLDCLRHIRAATRKLYNDMTGRVEVTVETADAISQEVASQIEQRLTAALGRQVELCCSVNPDLLGGLVVRVGDTVYDGSLSRRLEKMRGDTLDQTARLIRDSLQRFTVSD